MKIKKTTNLLVLRSLIFLGLVLALAVPQRLIAQSNVSTNSVKIAMIEGMSGAFANAGEAVARNLRFAVEQVNARGGVRLKGGAVPLELLILDGKGQIEESLLMLKAASDKGAVAVLQGNSSSVAAGLIEGIEKHNQRVLAAAQMLYLNYSAVDPALTNEKCSPWHFRFDAHIDMRMVALVAALAQDKTIKRVYLLNQDYVFGQQVAASARRAISATRPDIQIVGDELHPVGRIKDFAPYASKIKAVNADAVLTGNWGNDLALFVKSAKEVGLNAQFFTFYGNALGTPATLGEQGVGKVIAVSEWHSNARFVANGKSAKLSSATQAYDDWYGAYKKRFPDGKDDYFNPRNVLMIEMWVAALEQASHNNKEATLGRSAAQTARYLEGARATQVGLQAVMRAEDHQLIQPLWVYRMEKRGAMGVINDVENSGFGFQTVLQMPAKQLALPHTCMLKSQ